MRLQRAKAARARNSARPWRRYLATALLSFALLLHGGMTPLMSLAAAGVGGEVAEWVEICTGTGTKLVQLPDGEQDQPATTTPYSNSCDACACGGCGCSGGAARASVRIDYPSANLPRSFTRPLPPAHLLIVAANLSRGPPTS
jgi:hypothetical protein